MISLKTSFATTTGIQTFALQADFNGVEGAILWNGLGPARSIYAVGAGAGSFVNGSTITINGWRGTADVQEVLTFSGVNGGTLRGQKLFDGIVSVIVGAQANGSGTILLGTGDIAGPAGDGGITAVRIYAAGSLWVRYSEDSNLDDEIAVTALSHETIRPSRILAGSHASRITSAVRVGVYF